MFSVIGIMVLCEINNKLKNLWKFKFIPVVLIDVLIIILSKLMYPKLFITFLESSFQSKILLIICAILSIAICACVITSNTSELCNYNRETINFLLIISMSISVLLADLDYNEVNEVYVKVSGILILVFGTFLLVDVRKIRLKFSVEFLALNLGFLLTGLQPMVMMSVTNSISPIDSTMVELIIISMFGTIIQIKYSSFENFQLKDFRNNIVNAVIGIGLLILYWKSSSNMLSLIIVNVALICMQCYKNNNDLDTRNKEIMNKVMTRLNMLINNCKK